MSKALTPFDEPFDAAAQDKALDRYLDLFILRLWTDASTNENLRGTAYGLYNAVVEYMDHFAPVQGKDGDLARAQRVAAGDVTRVKDTAFEKVLAAVQ